MKPKKMMKKSKKIEKCDFWPLDGAVHENGWPRETQFFLPYNFAFIVYIEIPYRLGAMVILKSEVCKK